MASSIGEQTTLEQSSDMARQPVGAVLKAKREQLGWSLPDVAAWLRIRLSYLEALESGQVSKLPGGAYAMGFLRAYAGALGLDAEEMARRFRTETKDVAAKPVLSFPVPVPERGVPAGAIVLLGVVVVVGAYVGWYEFTGHFSRETHVVPPVPAPLLPLAGGAAPTASPQVATVMPGPGQTPSPLPPTDDKTTPSAQPSALSRAQSAASSAETAGVPAQTPVPATPAPIPAPTASTVPAGTTQAGTTQAGTTQAVTTPAGTSPPGTAPATTTVPAGRITLNAIAASWVQVREVGGKVLYDHILQPGESWSVPADATGDLALSTGNAGGLTVSADGTTSPVLGKVGGVRRGVPLSVQAVKDGSIALADGAAPTTPKAPGVVASTPDADVPAPALMHKPRPPRPAAPPVEDETERLNRAQLKTPPPQ